jgi:glutamine amidotransferase
METNGPPSDLVLSHIRLATQGEAVLHNTQPFQRELGGRAHVFAHNGDLVGIRDECHLESRRFTPVGDTDSELAFCCLLERLAQLWDQAKDALPSVESRLEVVADFAAWLRPLGPFNFIYSDGDTLFEQDDGSTRPPGLYLLVRSSNEQAVDLTDSGVLLAPTAQELVLIASVPLTDEPWEPIAQELVLIASVPLTDEPWEPISEGEVVALKMGVVWERASRAAVA